VVDVGVNGNLVVALDKGVGFWQISGNGKGEYTEDGCTRIGEGEGDDVDGFVGTLRSPEEKVINTRGYGISWRKAVGDIKRRKWRKWLESRMNGDVVQAKLDEEEDSMLRVRRLDMRRSQKCALMREMRTYVMVEGTERKLFYREKNSELASCILETDVKKVLADLHEGHGHLAVNITRSRAD